MKSNKILITALLVSYLIHPACQTPKATWNYKETQTHITIKKGDTFTIQLEGNIGTGYSWELADSLDNKQLAQQIHEFKQTPATATAAPHNYEEWKFTAKATGKTQIKLIYIRPFEHPTPKDAQQKTFDVEIN
jgi:predicted secreted protein